MAILFIKICFEKLQDILWTWSSAKKYDFKNQEPLLPGHPNDYQRQIQFYFKLGKQFNTIEHVINIIQTFS